jgi:hypothetical protein
MSQHSVVLLALALMWLPAPAGAQSVEAAVKGGVSIASIPRYSEVLREEGATDIDKRYGAVVGGHVALPFSDLFAIQPEFLYAQRGIEGRVPIVQNQRFQLKLDYVDLPVLVRLGPQTGGFQFLAGPSFNFNTSARLILEGAADDEEDVKDEVNSFELGVVVGAGYYGSFFLLEGRYQEGLTDIADFGDELGTRDDSYRNRSVVVMVGVRFGR